MEPESTIFHDYLDRLDPDLRISIEEQLRHLEEQATAIHAFQAFADDLSTKFHNACEAIARTDEGTRTFG